MLGKCLVSGLQASLRVVTCCYVYTGEGDCGCRLRVTPCYTLAAIYSCHCRLVVLDVSRTTRLDVAVYTCNWTDCHIYTRLDTRHRVVT